MVFLALDDFYFVTIIRTVPSYLLDVIQQTSSTLSQALPPELNAKMRLNQTTTSVSDETSLAAGMYRNVLHLWMKDLWHFTKEYNEPGNLDPLPSFVWIAFTNPEMTRRMREQRDLAVRVVGRCIEALVVNKLAADISRNTLVKNDERAACLSTILGTDVTFLLNHPGAIKFTNMIFLTLDDFYSSTLRTVPSDVLDVVRRTFSTLSQALPPELNAGMRLNLTDALMNASDGTLMAYRSVLRLWMKDLWQSTREYNEPRAGNRVPLPSSVCAAFTNPEMTHRIRKHTDHAVRMIGHCVQALVVNKLAADINSRNVPVGDNELDLELDCLSAILGTESHDVRLCLSQSGTVELVNLASLALGDFSPSRADQIPPDTRPVLQQTLAILSQALPAQENAEPLSLDQRVALINDNSELTIISRLHGLLKMCVSGASSLTEEVRISCLRMCLKSLWHCGKPYLQTSDPLPPYFPLVLDRPEITRHFLTEQDPAARITGCCYGALIVGKLVGSLGSPISLGGRVHNTDLACVSAVLGTEHGEVSFLPHQLHVVNFRHVVSVMSDVIDTPFTATAMPADVLNIAQDTLYILVGCMFVPEGLPRDQRRLLRELYLDITNALRSDRLKNETAKTLYRLRQILEWPLPGSQDTATATQNPDH
ncbi:hypothetical protein EDB83DRAFT_2387839 [Lactarius deliciosus]|nr:hypothetical protein EDB83DRAFT_2387839 [Lactarius deliciosus]